MDRTDHRHRDGFEGVANCVVRLVRVDRAFGQVQLNSNQFTDFLLAIIMSCNNNSYRSCNNINIIYYSLRHVPVVAQLVIRCYRILYYCSSIIAKVQQQCQQLDDGSPTLFLSTTCSSYQSKLQYYGHAKIGTFFLARLGTLVNKSL